MRMLFRYAALAAVTAGFVMQARADALTNNVDASQLCPTNDQSPLPVLAKRFLLAQLALSPVEAAAAGLHTYEGRNGEVNLDREMDDFSPASLEAQHKLLLDGQRCFARFDERSLPAEDAVDLEMLRRTIADSLYRDAEVQDEHYRPDRYVELVGSALFFPLTWTNGTEQQRLENVVARMAQVPRLYTQAKANLRGTDPVFIDTAVEENAGNREVIASIGERIPAASPLRAQYDAASKQALVAVDDFSAWLKNDLAKQPHTRTWRTGATVYGHLFADAVGPESKETPATVLAAAERDLVAVRQQMYGLAAPLYAKWFAEKPLPASLTEEERQKQTIVAVIGRINDDHAAPADLLKQVRSQAAGIHQFILDKNLLTLSARDNMKVVETPAFLRGAFSVAGFHAPPPLDPTAEADYWVTPIGADTPKAAAESKLREYNNWMLQYLTMHEALPGHYTQFEHANDVQPPERRLIRALLADGAYVEGWGEYGVKEMVDAGYAGNDPRFVLMVLKIRMRVIANTILDIRMQTTQMTDAEALELLEQQAFQTHAEAVGKLRRAKLTAIQLTTYYIGFHQWIALRDAYQKREGARFDLKRFNNAALNEGAVPVPLLSKLLPAQP
ncbi:MAG TPA: DUF885 domain-containing protein [Acidobacteriaceae bacterium]|nr:DUF885 domain-containing protein [Acidobacteriaceae bacterium]